MPVPTRIAIAEMTSVRFATDRGLRVLCAGIALLSVASWIVAASRADLWQPFEPDLVETAREMWLRHDWVMPYLNDLPYYEKPPLYYWSAMLVAHVAGRFNELTARVPSIVSGVVMLIVVWQLGRALFGVTTAWIAAAMFATTPVLVYCSTKGMTDALLGAATLASILFFQQAIWERDRLTERARSWRTMLAWLSLGLGFLAKGPVAVVLVGLTLLPEVWCSRRTVDLRRDAARHLRGIIAFALLVVPWYALGAREHGMEFVRGALLEQNVGRFLELKGSSGPLFYLENLPGQLGVWALLLPALAWLVVRARGPRFQPVRFLALGVVAQIVFLSAAEGKIPKYLLPAVGLLCLPLADAVGLAAQESGAASRAVRIGSVLAAVLLIAGPIAVPLALSEHPDLPAPWLWTTCALGLLGGAVALWLDRRGRIRAGVLVPAGVLAAGLLLLAASPVLGQINEIKSSRRFAERAALHLDPHTPLYGYWVSPCESLFLYYARHSYRLPDSIEDIVAARHRGRVLVLTREPFFLDLPERERPHFRVLERQEEEKRDYLLVEGSP